MPTPPRLCQDSRPARGIGAGARDGKARPARDIDLALHLPLRYEDETRLTPIAALRDGVVAQVEGVVADCRIETRPRRQLLVRLRDGRATSCCCASCTSTRRSRRAWRRVRACACAARCAAASSAARWCTRASRWSAEHSPLPTALTPVYPTSAQLPQAYLRKAIVSALARAPLHELLPPELAARRPAAACARRCSSCTTRRRRPAWTR